MKEFIALLKTELQLQKRAGFFFVVIIITLLWLVILHFIDSNYIGKTLGLVLSLDISSVALLTCIGLHLLEVRLNVVNALLVTPLNIALKLSVRILVTSLVSALTGLIISLPYVTGADSFTLFVICLLNSMLYAVAGALLSVYKPTISGIFVSMGLITPLWLAAYLPYLDLYSHTLLTWLPTYGITQMFITQQQHYNILLPDLISWFLWLTVLGIWLLLKYRSQITRG